MEDTIEDMEEEKKEREDYEKTSRGDGRHDKKRWRKRKKGIMKREERKVENTIEKLEERKKGKITKRERGREDVKLATNNGEKRELKICEVDKCSGVRKARDDG